MKKVCITQLEDGTFEVEVETEEPQGMPEAPEMPEGMAEEQTESAESFQTLEEAIAAVKGKFGPGGKPMLDGEAELQDSFVSGFKDARGKNGGF